MSTETLPPIGSRVRRLKVGGALAAWWNENRDGIVIEHVPERTEDLYDSSQPTLTTPAHARARFGILRDAPFVTVLMPRDEGRIWERLP